MLLLFLLIFREEVKLGAVNSINWARVLAQMTYYFWAHFRVRCHTHIIQIHRYTDTASTQVFTWYS